MIMVCDKMMGLGKSSSCITYMNEHPDQKFIYISPYTDEDRRIALACPKLSFKEPSDKNKNSGYSKSMDTALLMSMGENIASTHQCFKYYTADVIEHIKRFGYTLMIDENVAVLDEYKDVNQCDLDVMHQTGYLEMQNGEYRLTDKEYRGKWGMLFWRLMRSRTLITTGDDHNETYYYWALPEELLTAFKDVVIMTYMFEGTDMYYYMKMHNIPFKYIGVRNDNGVYRFSDELTDDSTLLASLKDRVHICNNPKRNAVGDDYNALSMGWFSRGGKDVDMLRSQLYNWFINDHRGHSKNKRLWASIGTSHGLLRSAGVWNTNLVFNTRATNDYADRTILAYPANVFVNVDKKNYYLRNGLEFNEDQYALSTMVQWIWRSAIRKGEEIWIYIPSRRMRELLQGWLDGLASGSEVHVTGSAEEVCA